MGWWNGVKAVRDDARRGASAKKKVTTYLLLIGSGENHLDVVGSHNGGAMHQDG